MDIEITKKYFDEQFKSVRQYTDKHLLESKKYFDEQIKSIKQYTHKQILENRKYFDFQFKHIEKLLDSKIGTLRSEIIENYTELKGDIRVLQADVAEIRRTVKEHNERNLEDSNAFARTLVSHNKRISNLERAAGYSKVREGK